MMLPPLLALLLVAPPISKTPAKDPSMEVIIDDVVLTLPLLPKDGKQARAENAQIQAGTAKGIQDLEKNLLSSYPILAQEAPLGANIGVPKDRAEEARFLASMLNDVKANAMEDRFVETWNGWQVALLDTGAARVVGEQSLLERPEESASKAAELNRQMRLTDESEAMARVDLEFAITTNTPMTVNGPTDPAAKTALLSHRIDTESRKKVQLARTHAVVTQKQAPELALLWTPLAEHLNAQAVTFMDYERAPMTSEFPTMKTLRLQAKAVFLERYRRALWTCSVVWAQMASADTPPPLRELAMPKMNGTAAKADPNFRFSQLAENRVAMWPITAMESDVDTRKLIQDEYESQKAFLDAFTLKLSSRLLPACQAPSLDSTALSEALSTGGQRALQDPVNFIRSMASQGAIPPATQKLDLGQIPALKGIKYGLLCRGFRIARLLPAGSSDRSGKTTSRTLDLEDTTAYFITFRWKGGVATEAIPAGGIKLDAMMDDHRKAPVPLPAKSAMTTGYLQNEMQTQTTGMLQLTLMDLETGALVWEETFRVETGPEREKAFYDVQELLAAKVLARLTSKR
jgi:hypothetical protein